MKNYMVIDKQCAEQILDLVDKSSCYHEFAEDMGMMIELVSNAAKMGLENPNDKELHARLIIYQMFTIGLAFRNNIELIQELISCIKFREVPAEEFYRNGRGFGLIGEVDYGN